MDPITLGALGALGVGVYVATKKPAPAPAPASTGAATTTAGGTFYRRTATFVGVGGIASPYVVGGTTGAVSQAQAIAAVKAKMQAEYDRLSQQARTQGAKLINEKLGTNLTGNEKFADAVATIGGVAAASACAATGVGTTLAGLCGIAGAYLGKKLGDYFDDQWSDIKSWAADQWNDIEDWGSGVVEDVGNFLSDLF